MVRLRTQGPGGSLLTQTQTVDLNWVPEIADEAVGLIRFLLVDHFWRSLAVVVVICLAIILKGRRR